MIFLAFALINHRTDPIGPHVNIPFLVVRYYLSRTLMHAMTLHAGTIKLHVSSSQVRFMITYRTLSLVHVFHRLALSPSYIITERRQSGLQFPLRRANNLVEEIEADPVLIRMVTRFSWLFEARSFLKDQLSRAASPRENKGMGLHLSGDLDFLLSWGYLSSSFVTFPERSSLNVAECLRRPRLALLLLDIAWSIREYMH